MSIPEKVKICEVSLRDGLQSVDKTLSVSEKLSVLRKIENARFPALEIGSLVSAKAVPQLAETPAVWEAVRGDETGTELRVLVVNPKGLLRAADMGIRNIQISVSASETHQLKNAGSPLSAMFPLFVEYAAGRKLALSATISTSFGCPFEGKISPDAVKKTAEGLMEFGVKEISLADTTGMAKPDDIFTLCEKMHAEYRDTVWGLHLHLRPENLCAIVRAGLEAGIDRFDSSLLGLGGCPFDDGNAGNVNTFSLMSYLRELGIETGIDGVKAAEAEAALKAAIG